jgi:hypothetical protein
LVGRLRKLPSANAHAVRSNHPFEVAATTIGAICYDYTPFQGEPPQYVRKKRVAKDEDTATALARLFLR